MPQHQGRAAELGAEDARVVVLDYGSGNLRSAERALAGPAPTSTVTADPDAALDADGLVVPGVGAFAACMAGLRAVARRRDHRPPAGRRPAGARHLRRHAGAVRARASSTASRPRACACCPARSSRSTRRVLPHMGWNTVDAPAGLAGCSPASSRTSASTSCTPTRVRDWSLETRNAALRAPAVTWASTASRSWPRSRTARCPPRSSTPRSPATPAPRCCANWLGTLMTALRSRPESRLELLPAVDVADGQAVRLVQGEAGTETSYGDPLEAALAWQRAGAEWIHLVDLDAAFGRGSNRELLAEVVGALDVKVELSGGIRDDDSLAAALGHRLRPGQPRHRRAGEPGVGARRSSPSTATGSRSAWTSAAPRCRPRLDPGGRRPLRDARPARRRGLRPLRRHRRHQGRHAAAARTWTCCARSAPRTDRPVVASRRRLPPGRPAGARRAGAAGRRGRDRRQGAVRGGVHPATRRWRRWPS